MSSLALQVRIGLICDPNINMVNVEEVESTLFGRMLDVPARFAGVYGGLAICMALHFMCFADT